MKRVSKIISRIAAVCLVTGMVLLVIGYVSGAKSGFYMNGSGIHVLDMREGYHYEQLSLTDIQKISVDMNNAKIVLKKSENGMYGFAVQLDSQSNSIDISTEQHAITLKQQDEAKVMFNFDFFHRHEEYVYLYLPEGAQLKDILVKTSNGTIQNETALQTDTLYAQTSNGKITLTDIFCRLQAECKTSNGAIVCEGHFLEKLSAKTSNGKIQMSGSFGKDTQLQTSNGHIAISLDGKESDYAVDAKTSNGKITVNGNVVGDNVYQTKMSNGKGNLSLKTSNGPISITSDENGSYF